MLVIALAACGGGNGEEEGEPTPSGTVPVGPGGSVPTTTPLAQVPEPTIVTGDGGGGSSSDVSYTVEAGDTLGTIAQRFGVPIDEIREANDLEGDNIFVGQELTIPRAGGTPPGATSTPGTGATPPPAATATVPAATATPPPSGGGNVHIVESGDTPLGIALQYDITLEELEEANGGPFLDPLQIGQEIIIP